MVPLIMNLWDWDSRLRDFLKITREGCSRAKNRNKLPQNAAQGSSSHNQPLYLVSALLSSTPFFLTNYYSSWQTLDACSVQHWARTGYRNIRSSYWLGSNWGKFFFRQFTGLHMLSIFLLYYSASNLLHRYKEETADPTQLIDNFIQSVSSFIRTCKTQ